MSPPLRKSAPLTGAMVSLFLACIAMHMWLTKGGGGGGGGGEYCQK